MNDHRSPDLRPSDLAAEEAQIAELFESLESRPPDALGSRVLGAFEPPPRGGFRVPRGPFGIVGAALVLLLVGAVVWISRAARDAELSGMQPEGAVAEDPVDDPRVPLYRGLETFQSLDVGRPDAEEPLTSCGEDR